MPAEAAPMEPHVAAFDAYRKTGEYAETICHVKGVTKPSAILYRAFRAGWEAAKKPDPVPWDANHNRSYEPVETLAKVIYDGFVYDGPAGTKKPAWTPGGNGFKQDEARSLAREHLRQAGHDPA